MSTVIKIENLGKKYFLGQNNQRYSSLRESLSKLPNFFKDKSPKKDFWALQNISLDIKEGDRVGILGRNGAGKSTLLKVLSKITEPTTGTVKVKGRIASLLEVGTGFHPELTGRENIFLNGIILGMKRSEIKSKFDEIVAFSEIEKFLDTPVKRYSSGMYMRLAFAVAAHLDPEILLVDEVLAVGDAQFQKKCLSKMEDINKSGRTILFVSHNMEAIRSLCNKGIILSDGKLHKYADNIDEALSIYSKSEICYENKWINQTTEENEWLRPLKLELIGKNFSPFQSATFSKYDKVFLKFDFELKKNDPALTVGYRLNNEDGYTLYWSYQTDTAPDYWPQLTLGRNTVVTELPVALLNSGKYTLELIGGLHYRQWLYEPGKSNPQISFEIEGKYSDSPLWTHKRPGLIAPINNWERKDL